MKVTGKPGEWTLITESGIEVKIKRQHLDRATAETIAALIDTVYPRIISLEQRVTKIEQQLQQQTSQQNVKPRMG